MSPFSLPPHPSPAARAWFFLFNPFAPGCSSCAFCLFPPVAVSWYAVQLENFLAKKVCTKNLQKNAYYDSKSLSSFDTVKAEHALSQSENSNPDKTLSEGKLGTKCKGMSPIYNSPKEQWAGLDSNQRRLTPTGLQPVPFSRSGTDPTNSK